MGEGERKRLRAAGAGAAPQRQGRAGRAGDSLLVRVKAAPVGGEANEAARRLLASVLGVAASRVELVRGVRSREKEFRVLGLLPEEVPGRLQGPGSPL